MFISPHFHLSFSFFPLYPFLLFSSFSYTPVLFSSHFPTIFSPLFFLCFFSPFLQAYPTPNYTHFFPIFIFQIFSVLFSSHSFSRIFISSFILSFLFSFSTTLSSSYLYALFPKFTFPFLLIFRSLILLTFSFSYICPPLNLSFLLLFSFSSILSPSQMFLIKRKKNVTLVLQNSNTKNRYTHIARRSSWC